MSPVRLREGRLCAVADCGRLAGTRGLCDRHYQRLRKHGHPTAGATFRNRTPPEFCSVEGCEQPHGSMGYCDLHYSRWRRHGDPTVKVHFTDPEEAMALRREVLPSPCWIWTGGTTNGYGAIVVDGEPVLAHRYAFEKHHERPVGDGLELHHVCFNRRCVNPEHVEEVTPEEHARLHGLLRRAEREDLVDQVAGELAS